MLTIIVTHTAVLLERGLYRIYQYLIINIQYLICTYCLFQGVVSGVLLVTPNAVMFDPNVSDTLVMEHGPESYGVIAPMEYVVNAAIFYDIAHMRTHGPDQNTHK